VLACAAVGGAVALARALDFDEPPPLDVAVRRTARLGGGPRIARAMVPLFPLGLPGGYLTIAYLAAHHLHRNGRRGGPEIVTSAWCGWLAQRGVKLFYRRERPVARGKRYRTDSFPSGHTTGLTSLAVASALALSRQRLVSPVAAAAIAVGASTLMGAYRVLADDHWTTDVVGGWMVGGAVALACDALLAGATGGAAHGAARAVTARGRKRRLLRRPGR